MIDNIFRIMIPLLAIGILLCLLIILKALPSLEPQLEDIKTKLEIESLRKDNEIKDFQLEQMRKQIFEEKE